MGELKVMLEERRKLVDKKATEYRSVRDDWNAKTKEHLVERNRLNGEVRELIENVKQQREIRERMNDEVRERKAVRTEANSKVRAAKESIEGSKKDSGPRKDGPRDKKGRPITIHSLRRERDRIEHEFNIGAHTGKNEKKAMERMKKIQAQIKDMEKSESANTDLNDARGALATAMAEQEAAHSEVTLAAEQAQQAHDLMLEWNKEVDSRRDSAEGAHRRLRRSKKEADSAHHSYILSLRCLHSIQDMIRAERDQARGAAPTKTAREGVQDLMAKLMSGETLTTEELLDLQRFE